MFIVKAKYRKTQVMASVFFFFLSDLGGFAFLPFLWLVNVVWFFKEAFVKPAYTEQPQIKICEYDIKQFFTHLEGEDT